MQTSSSSPRTYISTQRFKVPSSSFVKLRFARDALFERNDRFENVAETGSKELQNLEYFLGDPFPGQRPKVLAKKVSQLSGFLYDNRGRLRGKGALSLGLKAASMEYALMSASKYATKIDKGLFGIKLANAKLAADIDNSGAFELLDRSIRMLKMAGYKPGSDLASAIYIHGLYNRGSYFMNNDLYKETLKIFGPEKMSWKDVAQEGLAFASVNDTIEDRNRFRVVQEGLPYLDEAIRLAQGLQDDNIALAEYLSAKGEAFHLLSHLNYEDIVESRLNAQNAFTAFKMALEELGSIERERYSPRHYKLFEKLGLVKIPHVCVKQHRLDDAHQTIAQQIKRNVALILIDMKSRSLEPPKTPAEEKAEHRLDPFRIPLE